MRKFICLLLLLGLSFGSNAQSKPDSLQVLFDMVQQLKKQQKEVQQLMEQREKDKAKMASLEAQISKLKNGQDQNDDANRQALLALEKARQADSYRVNALQDSIQSSQVQLSSAMSQLISYRKKIDSLQSKQNQFSEVEVRLKVGEEIKYRHIKQNLINLANLYELMNEKLNALDAFKQLGSYQNLLQDLNNPSSNTLGFSYNEKVLELMEENLLAERDRSNSKILGFAKTLLESPLATGLKSMMPVVSTANSLLGFISGISVERKDITQEKFHAFKQELQRYTLFYARMNEANAQFKVGLTQYQSQIKSLHEKLKEQVVSNANLMSIKIKGEKDKYSTGEYLLYVFQDYNRSEAIQYFNELEKKHTNRKGIIDYGALLKQPNLQDSYRYTESAMLLFRDFEKLYTQYLQMINDNNEVVTEILEQAKDNNIGKGSMIKDQIGKLEQAKEATKGSVRTAINLPKLNRISSLLSKFPPTL